jgi:hypothetical protein
MTNIATGIALVVATIGIVTAIATLVLVLVEDW